MKRQLIALALATAGLSAFAYNSNYWQPVEGDWNGSYADTRHWSSGHLPNVSQATGGEDAIFPVLRGTNYTVTIDCTVGEGEVPLPAFIKLLAKTGVTKATAGWVRFAGSGTVSQKHEIHVQANCRLEIGGALTVTKPSINVNASSALRFADDCRTGANGLVGVYDDTDIEIAGGTLTSAFTFYNYTIGSFHVTGGDLTLLTPLNGANFTEACDFTFTGGKISVGWSVTEARFFPSGTATLSVTQQSTGAITIGDAVRRASGNIYNYSSTYNSIGLRFDDSATFWSGQSHFFTGWFLPFGGKDYIFGIRRLDIGDRYYPASSANVVFPTDMTLGAWGDFTIQTTVGNRFYGKLTFDSTDAFDHESARTFTFRNLVPGVGASLGFTGVGRATAVLLVPNGQSRLRAITVDAGTTATLASSDAKARLKVAGITLGAGAKLVVDPNVGPIETLTTPVLGEGAKIVLNLANLTASEDGTSIANGLVVRSVLVDMEGTGLPDSAFELQNMPSGKDWTLKRLGGAVYLQDANVTPGSDRDYSAVWIGTAANNETDVASNWSGGATPSSLYWPDVRFRFDGTNEVNVTKAFSANQIDFGGGLYSSTPQVWRRCGPPYVLRGEKITLNRTGSGQSSALMNYTKIMTVIHNDVYFRNNNMHIYSVGPLVLAGTVTATAGASVTIDGDVRVSGSMTFADYKSVSASTTFEYDSSSLTALAGGTITATAQTSAFANPMTLVTAPGGSIAFPAAEGAAVSYTYAQELDHFIDGTLTFGAPLSLAKSHTFGGRGTVSFASVTTAEGASVILADGITASVASMDGASWAVRNGSAATIRPTAEITGGAAVTNRTDATLTLDAADPVRWGATALQAGSTFVKKGAGTLALASLAAEEDTAIRFDGAVGTITVDDDVDLSTCAVTLTSAAASTVRSDWADVLTVTEGHEITGAAVGRRDGYRLRLSADGRTLQARGKPGLALIVR